MALFHYRARGLHQELISGEFEASDAPAVANHLLANNITPIDIRPAAEAPNKLTLPRLRLPSPRVRLDDLYFFCRQMHTLLRAGIPIMDALRGLHDSTPNPSLAQVIGDLRSGLDAGMELSTALRQHPRLFSTLFIGLIEMGESSGQLPQSFRQLADYIERERDTRHKIRAAMRYPAFVISAIVMALLIINVFVIPAFADVFSKFHAQLPLMTRILIATSDFITDYWYLLVALLTAGGIALSLYLKTAAGRLHWHRLQLKLPVTGKIFYQSALGRFAYTLSITVRAGVPWGKGMTVVSNAVHNEHIGTRVLEMRERIEAGDTITHTAQRSGLFPPLVLQMIKVGEQTGELDQLLEEVAEYYEGEVDYALKNLSASIEPILIVALGVIVLIMALGVFMPMWGLGQAALAK
ncbi:MAG: type II secretion system F family protein [Gammaproteobacteria bacterium]